jgi:hypothetical protein
LIGLGFLSSRFGLGFSSHNFKVGLVVVLVGPEPRVCAVRENLRLFVIRIREPGPGIHWQNCTTTSTSKSLSLKSLAASLSASDLGPSPPLQQQLRLRLRVGVRVLVNLSPGPPCSAAAAQLPLHWQQCMCTAVLAVPPACRACAVSASGLSRIYHWL